MAKLHHATLKSAVGKYGRLHEEGKSEDEIKQAIAGDERGFEEEEVNQIYNAISVAEDNHDQSEEEVSEEERGGSIIYIVESEFRDISDFHKIHRVGDDVSHFEKERLERLIHLELIAKK